MLTYTYKFLTTPLWRILKSSPSDTRQHPNMLGCMHIPRALTRVGYMHQTLESEGSPACTSLLLQMWVLHIPCCSLQPPNSKPVTDHPTRSSKLTPGVGPCLVHPTLSLQLMVAGCSSHPKGRTCRQTEAEMVMLVRQLLIVSSQIYTIALFPLQASGNSPLLQIFMLILLLKLTPLSQKSLPSSLVPV